jgi:hypothetical protein
MLGEDPESHERAKAYMSPLSPSTCHTLSFSRSPTVAGQKRSYTTKVTWTGQDTTTWYEA